MIIIEYHTVLFFKLKKGDVPLMIKVSGKLFVNKEDNTSRKSHEYASQPT